MSAPIPTQNKKRKNNNFVPILPYTIVVSFDGTPPKSIIFNGFTYHNPILFESMNKSVKGNLYTYTLVVPGVVYTKPIINNLNLSKSNVNRLSQPNVMPSNQRPGSILNYPNPK